MATDTVANEIPHRARGAAQIALVALIPAFARVAVHLVSVIRHATNVSPVLNAFLLAMLVASMLVGHVQFMRRLNDPEIERSPALEHLAHAETSLAMVSSLAILLALGFPFSIG